MDTWTCGTFFLQDMKPVLYYQLDKYKITGNYLIVLCIGGKLMKWTRYCQEKNLTLPDYYIILLFVPKSMLYLTMYSLGGYYGIR